MRVRNQQKPYSNHLSPVVVVSLSSSPNARLSGSNWTSSFLDPSVRNVRPTRPEKVTM